MILEQGGGLLSGSFASLTGISPPRAWDRSFVRSLIRPSVRLTSDTTGRSDSGFDYWILVLLPRLSTVSNVRCLASDSFVIVA